MMVAATSLTAINNIIAVTQSGPFSNPLFEDIVTTQNFYDLIMVSFSSDDDCNLRHFVMTPIDVIEPG